MTHSPLPVGAEIAGRYRIAGPIGQGGMGVVYEAWDGSELRALKIMDPALVENPEQRLRFQREAHIGATLRGAHVTEVLDHGVDAATGMPFIVMERLRGQELGALVAQRGRLPLREARQLLSELCEALAGAHAAGVVHRDLKPNNLFVSDPGGIKVLDFGIAKVLAEWRTTNSLVVGTPGWMSPEQLDAHGEVGPSTDVWAIGLLAFYMLTGKEYWLAANSARDSWAAVCKEICVDPIVAASTRAAAYGVAEVLPPGFDAWFAQCVHRTPAARFANAAVAHGALDPLLKIKLVKTPPPGPVEPVQTVVTRLPSSPGLPPAVDVLSATVFAPPFIDPEAEETLALAHAASELRSRVQSALGEMARDTASRASSPRLSSPQLASPQRLSSPQLLSPSPVAARATPAPPLTFVAHRPNVPPQAVLPPTVLLADPDSDPDSVDALIAADQRAKRQLRIVLALVAAGIVLVLAAVAWSGPSPAPAEEPLLPTPTFTGRPDNTATLRPEQGTWSPEGPRRGQGAPPPLTGDSRAAHQAGVEGPLRARAAGALRARAEGSE